MSHRQEEIEQELRNVEREDGALVVVSRYGFKKVEINGKFYLEAMSKEDLLIELDASGSADANELAAKVRAGTLDNGGCVSDNGSVRCLRIDLTCKCVPSPRGGGGYLCYCTH